MAGVGKVLILVGILMVILGALFYLGARIPWLGQLPGDFTIKRERFILYFPFATCLLVSLVITLVIYIIRR